MIKSIWKSKADDIILHKTSGINEVHQTRKTNKKCYTDGRCLVYTLEAHK